MDPELRLRKLRKGTALYHRALKEWNRSKDWKDKMTCRPLKGSDGRKELLSIKRQLAEEDEALQEVFQDAFAVPSLPQLNPVPQPPSSRDPEDEYSPEKAPEGPVSKGRREINEFLEDMRANPPNASSMDMASFLTDEEVEKESEYEKERYARIRKNIEFLKSLNLQAPLKSIREAADWEREQKKVLRRLNKEKKKREEEAARRRRGGIEAATRESARLHLPRKSRPPRSLQDFIVDDGTQWPRISRNESRYVDVAVPSQRGSR